MSTPEPADEGNVYWKVVLSGLKFAPTWSGVGEESRAIPQGALVCWRTVEADLCSMASNTKIQGVSPEKEGFE